MGPAVPAAGAVLALRAHHPATNPTGIADLCKICTLVSRVCVVRTTGMTTGNQQYKKQLRSAFTVPVCLGLTGLGSGVTTCVKTSTL